MKNTVKILFGAFLALAVIAIASFLTFAPEEMSILVITDVQVEPEPINSIPPEISPPVTAAIPPIITSKALVITTTPLITTTEPSITTTAPPVTTTSTIITITTLQIPENAQGTDEYGFYYKIEDGQRYIWNHVVGWCRDDGPGEVTIMNVQSDGYRFYRESDGTVNLDKIIAPDGSVISFDEYQRIRESR
jgi:hypothetical protein